jgi:poly(3-hydroxybutyrate) depolymerase
MPAEYYLETIKTVFQDFSLVNGTWEVKGTLVRPQDITGSALLTVEGELDDISGAGQTRAAHAMCTGIPKEHQFHYDVEGAGHYGIFSGRRWREMVYPVLRDFIRRYNPQGTTTPESSPEVDMPVSAPAAQASDASAPAAQTAATVTPTATAAAAAPAVEATPAKAARSKPVAAKADAAQPAATTAAAASAAASRPASRAVAQAQPKAAAKPATGRRAPTRKG